jgi:hypothetical protein
MLSTPIYFFGPDTLVSRKMVIASLPIMSRNSHRQGDGIGASVLQARQRTEAERLFNGLISSGKWPKVLCAHCRTLLNEVRTTIIF